MIAYFDSSALVKLVIPETGSDVAADAWRAADLRSTCSVAYTEVRSALAAIRRVDRITAQSLRVTRGRVDAMFSKLLTTGVDDELATMAGDLAEAYALRGFDAIHLASALATESEDLVLVTWDRELHSAAIACGRSVLPARI